MNFGPFALRIGAKVPRITYPEHGFMTAIVRKGHSYITVIVKHDTNTFVRAHKRDGKEVLDLFFNGLSPEPFESILVITDDGARWITNSMKSFCPNADHASSRSTSWNGPTTR